MNREDFDKIYEKVTAKKKYTFDELEDSYKDLKRKAIAANIIIGVIILLFICSFAYMIFFKGLEVKMWIYIALLIFCILLQFGINIYFKNYQLMMCDNYDVEYKENILKKVIGQIDSELVYNPLAGKTLKYDMDKLNELKLGFLSTEGIVLENYIHDKLNDIKICSYFLNNIYPGEKLIGNIEFSGIMGVMHLEKFKDTKVTIDSDMKLIKDYKKDLSDDEYNALYDLKVDDRELANQIIKRDFIEELSMLSKEIDFDYSITVLDEKAYLNVPLNHVVYFNMSVNNFSREVIEKEYLFFKNVIDLCKLINKHLYR
jgi:hypothetical protein